MFRFVICVDVEAKSLEEGYSKLYDSMKRGLSEDVEWESTDEVFNSDGVLVHKESIVKARMKKIANEEKRF